ncbi:NACHT, LRR and PYD domains-containing protein 12-like [Ctenopharyngodon idella]|uniref:NACHT, LRR and PYD domains-containing protein 12-like n=1 Tax=Ctenopharyngodon idella TaxID=7959 RepID=UPI00222EAC77|nr:NACHT, LRR and PYD domains-containing protein 12-like [Ctenopharyngodon idella]
MLSKSSIREEGCALLTSALRSNPSNMRELDMSGNQPGDLGVNMFSDLLEESNCKLETLKLTAVLERKVVPFWWQLCCETPHT